MTFYTFGRQLWETAGRFGLVPHPADLSALLEAWQAVHSHGG